MGSSSSADRVGTAGEGRPAVTPDGPARRRLTGPQRRASILAAASTVFGERGYEHVRSDDIAAAAGVSKALIYEHFRSKEDLYLELLDAAVRDLLARVIEAGSNPGAVGVERFEPAVRAALDWMNQDPHSFQLLARSVSDPAIAARQDELGRHAVAALAGLMEQEPLGRREGLDRPQLEQLARMIIGCVYGLAQWFAEHGDWEVEEAMEILMTFMWLGLGGLQEGRRWGGAGAPAGRSGGSGAESRRR